MRKVRKIILGSVMALATAISFASTTYAFVVINKEVDVEEFNFNLETDTGLLISLDGTNFSQDITLDMLKPVIEQNIEVKYEDALYEGVTLSQTAGKVNFDDNGNPIFVKDSIVLNDDNETYHHEYIETESDDYLTFDLYFRMVSQGDVTKTTTLKFKDNTAITGISSDVEINNSLTTKEGLKVSGDTVTVNPKDAMRLGVVNHNTSVFTVYEPSIGLASAAIEGRTDEDHNKETNAMYTYYNSTFPLSNFNSAAEDGEGFNTLSTFTENVLGEFSYNEETKSYNDLKLTIVVWLEGWDADYFQGIPVESTKINVKLAFEMIE